MTYDVFHSSSVPASDAVLDAGWYWWFCSPGCLPETDYPVGPFATREEAEADAQAEDAQFTEADPPARVPGDAPSFLARAGMPTAEDLRILRTVQEPKPTTDPMTRDTTEGWDGRPDGPDPCTCAAPRPVPFYGRTVCADCDGDIKDAEGVFDPIADAAQYRDERGER